MDGFDLNVSEKAEASELQRMIAIEQQKAQFQAQVSAMLTGLSRPFTFLIQNTLPARMGIMNKNEHLILKYLATN